jgi:ribulose-5-phosphate 4-epimerase/fuculose-1-phosphate aldolase
MKFETLKEELEARKSIVKWGKELYDCGMVKGSGGNISIRIGDNIILSPTGFFLGHLTEDCLSKTDMSGNLIDGLKPTKELPMHLAAYISNPNTKAVVHVHALYATALASMFPPDTYMPIYLPSVASKVGRVKITPFTAPGTYDLAKIVGNELREGSAVLLSNHGIITTGKSIEEAVSIAYEIEENAHLHYISNGSLKPLSEEILKDILKKYI